MEKSEQKPREKKILMQKIPYSSSYNINNKLYLCEQTNKQNKI